MKLKFFMFGMLIGALLCFISFKIFSKSGGGKFLLGGSESMQAKWTSGPLDSADAETYLNNFRDYHIGSSIAFTVDTVSIKQLLKIPGCEKIRAYFGVKDVARSDELTLMFVGVDKGDSNLLLPGNRVIDYTNPCPYNCPKNVRGQPSYSIKPPRLP